jgi:hypothetical protein
MVADAVSNSIGLLKYLKESDSYKPVKGGYELRHEVQYQDTGNFKYYTGFEKLDNTHRETLTFLQFDIKQAVAACSISGLEEAQNTGEEAFIDLLDERIKGVERTMRNNLGGTNGVYGNGTAFSGKAIDGLQKLISNTPTTGVVGGIDRATYTFNRNRVFSAATDGGAAKSAANIKEYLNKLTLRCSRDGEKPDLYVADDNDFALYESATQAIQRIEDTKKANIGWPEMYYKGAKFIYDGGFGGGCPANTTYAINTKHLFWRPHEKRNFTPLKKREAQDQDAMTQYVVWYGNVTYDLAFLNGVLIA